MNSLSKCDLKWFLWFLAFMLLSLESIVTGAVAWATLIGTGKVWWQLWACFAIAMPASCWWLLKNPLWRRQ